MKKLQENSHRNVNEWNSSAGVYGDNLLCKNINIINSQLQKIYEMPVQMLAYNLKHMSVLYHHNARQGQNTRLPNQSSENVRTVKYPGTKIN
jgi:hypothetical protein